MENRDRLCQDRQYYRFKSALETHVGRGFGSPYEARATSLPDGEIVADPIFRSTCMETSAAKVELSKADFMDFPFFESSNILTMHSLSHCWA